MARATERAMSDNLEVLPPNKANLPPVEIEEPQITDAEATESLKQFGLVEVNANTMRSLNLLGGFAKTKGLVQNQRGRAMVTQERVDEAMRAMADIVTGRKKINGKQAKFDQIIRAGATLSQLARSSCDSQRVVLEIEGFLPPSERTDREQADGTRKQSFKPGAAVTPHTTIYAQKVEMTQSAEPQK